MRIFLLTFVGLSGIAVQAQDSLGYRPIYMIPSALRAEQAKYPSDAPRLGLFGLSQPAAARFGWDRVQRDSAFAFAAAQTLWLDYYCVFGDSLCADLALVRSPRFTWTGSEQPQRIRAEQGFDLLPISRPNPLASDDLEALNEPHQSTQPLKVTVRSGDNFYRIISRHPKVTLEQLYRANKGSDRIFPGQILVIP